MREVKGKSKRKGNGRGCSPRMCGQTSDHVVALPRSGGLRSAVDATLRSPPQALQPSMRLRRKLWKFFGSLLRRPGTPSQGFPVVGSLRARTMKLLGAPKKQLARLRTELLGSLRNSLEKGFSRKHG